jgi:recombination protein RecR
MKHEYPDGFSNLTDLLKRLPGVGRRSAERMAFALLKWPPEKVSELGTAICELRKLITPCPRCGNLSSEEALCRICSAPSRDASVVCAVEEAYQIHTIELSGLFKGTYHVLGGRLSPLEGRGAGDLNIQSLLKRVDADNVKEVILALSNDVEGQATSIYLAEELKKKDVHVTRLAQGLPAGSDISYADAATIAAAIHGRRPL